MLNKVMDSHRHVSQNGAETDDRLKHEYGERERYQQITTGRSSETRDQSDTKQRNRPECGQTDRDEQRWCVLRGWPICQCDL